jgi:hypothetical protein
VPSEELVAFTRSKVREGRPGYEGHHRPQLSDVRAHVVLESTALSTAAELFASGMECPAVV